MTMLWYGEQVPPVKKHCPLDACVGRVGYPKATLKKNQGANKAPEAVVKATGLGDEYSNKKPLVLRVGG